MTQKIKRIWNAASTVLVVSVVLLSLTRVGPGILGLESYVVLSGSMEPNYPVGSMIYVRETDPDRLDRGDVITFTIGGQTVVTHRIVEVLADGTFRTQGDANDLADGSPVDPAEVIGTPVLCVPWLGQFASYIQKPPGSYAAIAVAAVIFLLVFLPDLLFAENKQKKSKS